MATSAQYATTPAYFTGTAATADSSYTAPTNAVLIMTGTSTAAGSGVGHRIYRASAIVKGTSTQAVIRIFTSTDAGTTFQLLGEAMIPAVTAGSSTPISDVSLPFLEGINCAIGVFAGRIPEKLSLSQKEKLPPSMIPSSTIPEVVIKGKSNLLSGVIYNALYPPAVS